MTINDKDVSRNPKQPLLSNERRIPATQQQQASTGSARSGQQGGARDEDNQLSRERDSERETFRDERSPALRETEEADDGAPDDLLPGKTPPGWTSRNV